MPFSDLQISIFSYPASILGKGIKLIISDEVGFQIFFPIANALHSIIRVAININRPT